MKHFVQPAVRRTLIVENMETALLNTHHQRAADLILPGPLFLIGGALDEDPVLLERFAALTREAHQAHQAHNHATDAKTLPRIGIFTTASEPAIAPLDGNPETESDEADGEYYREVFARHQLEAIPLPVGRAAIAPYPGAPYIREAADDAQLAELVAGLDGLFFGGGDQTNYIFALFRDPASETATGSSAEGTPPGVGRTETAVMRAIRALHARGGVIAGTSAGLAIQQGSGMVTGGTSVRAWHDGVTPGYEDDEQTRFSVAGGFGFFAEGLLDSHFNEWDRVVRAVCLGRATGNRLVFGVDEHTALVYWPTERTGEVIGSGGVSIIDLEEAEWSSEAAAATALGVRWHHLLAGDQYRFDTEVITRAATEQFEPGTGPLPETAQSTGGEDVGPVLLRQAQALTRSAGAVAALDYIATDPGYHVTLLRDERTIWTAAGGFSALKLSITPLKHSPNHQK